jgi:Holliday junction resolvase RusA-like endonuclease
MEDRFPPLLRMSLHDAPHRRMHVATIQQYREDLRIALTKIGVKTPITVPIDLEIAFVNPSTPDLGNAYLALEQAMDGKTLKGPGIVADDSLISKVTMFKFFTEKPKK